MSEFDKVVAWDSKGPIEVEMYVYVNGKKVVIQGDTTIEGMGKPENLSEKQPHISGEPMKTFHGMKWIT